MFRSALILLIGVAASHAQTTTDIAARADAYIKSVPIQGSVLLAKGGKIVLVQGYGLANIELGVANKPETKFRLGSVTKQFTSAAILQLQEQGKLKVEDPISKYIPDPPATWHYDSPSPYAHKRIPSYTDNSAYGQHMRDKAGTPLEFISRFRNLPLEFKPGTRFQYDNSGYFLLGVIIEQVFRHEV
jgi:CubicO group peptidase (beta-lactamase class C family)